jgi:MazG family protein
MAEDTSRPCCIEDSLRVMARLRDPETGCPWDREQTYATIAPYTIEEAYEVADAIARNDLDALKDELGDLLLQVVYHARMAEEDGRFAFGDVVDAITAKMVRRHPHVFEDASLRDAFLTSGTWDRIKAEEKAARGGKTGEGSLLDDVPVALPGLSRAVKLQSRAAKVGFDWPSLVPVLAKAEEEIAELKTAIIENKKSAKVVEEFGDLLFVHSAPKARHLEPRRWKRFISCGTRPRPRRPALVRNSYSAAMPSRAGPARRARRWRFSGATRIRKRVTPSPISERLITSQFS